MAKKKRGWLVDAAILIYRLLASGRDAAYWVTELQVMFDEVKETEGADAAFWWLLDEIGMSFKPVLVFRVFLVSRSVFRLASAAVRYIRSAWGRRRKK